MRTRDSLPTVVLCLVISLPLRADDSPAATKTSRSVRVAGIVLKWLRTEKDANFTRAEALIREAATGGAQIVCTTECFLDGYVNARQRKHKGQHPYIRRQHDDQQD